MGRSKLGLLKNVRAPSSWGAEGGPEQSEGNDLGICLISNAGILRFAQHDRLEAS